MNTGGSRVDNFHGCATCGQLATGGTHMDKFPLRLINQSETALQNYMVYVWIHVENVGPKPHYCTYYPHVSVCTHCFDARLPCVTWFFMCFTCAIHETRNL